ncbi:Uncharacterized protein OS=Xanthomonas perforans 91-118 GN=XPE_2373 PE=4 SV=1 [Gemmataceae bacterium]|nr:Uncharacterized protein OS=Xanthomonas perforans 91-118 GN=XPE_2373 PE=4 SV=1 [Gemmataceae bacterium]VTT97360.1 Uncharacterized protein OS=Xanthomonas perforans 91-118 GN=XPE_2373 PE=4 SV=1 [Gemmataceae bacterium]
MSDARDDLLQRTYEARDGYLRQLGEVDPLVLTHIINPAFTGGPRWPDLRQAMRVVRNGNRTIVVSDGLADPFDDQPEPNVGFGIEVLLETSDPIEGSIQNDWPFWIAYDVAQQAARHGGFRELIDELGVLSMDLQCRFGPSELATAEGRIGVLLGVHGPDFPAEWSFPAGVVKIVTVKVLHPSELAVAANEGDAGRKRLCDLFTANGTFHVSSATRPSVV